MTEDNIEKMIRTFNAIKELGYIRSHRSGNTGIGKTFEDACKIKENNIDAPDLHEFEIKSKRELATNKVTLFTKAPTMPKGANAMLKNNYGTPDENFEDIQVLHASTYHRDFYPHKGGYEFKLECDDKEERIYLLIKETKTNRIVSREVYWSYTVLRGVIEKKLQNLAFISAKTRRIDGHEEFHYTDMTLYSRTNFDRFLELVKSEDGLMFDLRIGAYKSGRQYGKPHDHGSGFRAKVSQIDSLYDYKIII
jgi:hypothetical protein